MVSARLEDFILFLLFLLMLASVLLPASEVLAYTHRTHGSRGALSFSRGFNRLRRPTTKLMSSAPSCPLLAGKNFVSVEECLAARKYDSIRAPVFVDGSWHLVPDRDARTEYEAGPRIEGAKFFDIDDIATTGKGPNPKTLPHMAPPKRLFAAAMDALGITNDDDIIVYGTEGNMFTSRAWYTFKAMGHDPAKVHLMQGSVKEWEEKGGPIERGLATTIKAKDLNLDKDPVYQANGPSYFCGMDDVASVIKGGDTNTILIDARPAGRFKGKDPEPREGLRGGHMPGAINIPFINLLDPSDRTKFKSVAELLTVFEDAGVDVQTEKRIISSCGSGATACVIVAALEECGRDPDGTDVYDGSWIEWGADPNTPIVKE